MKITLKQKLSPKPRGLIVYDSNSDIDINHPLYNEIMLFADRLEELHVIVCMNKKHGVDMRVINLAQNVFVYYMSSTSLLFHIEEIWSFLKYHLVWDGTFRPHVILNFSTHRGAWIGYILAKRYSTRLYHVTDGEFLEKPWYTFSSIQNRLLIKQSTLVVTPGIETQALLCTKMKLLKETVVVVSPPIDLSFMKRERVYVDYTSMYPMHNFFILTRASIGHRGDFGFLLKVFKSIIERYPRTALIVLVPAGHLSDIQRMISSSYKHAVHLICEDKNAIKYFGNAHLFLSATDSVENTISIIQALTTHVPVVTTNVGIAKELFSQSRYKEFMQSSGDTTAYTKAVLTLMEHQQLRDEYRLNTSILLHSLSLQTTQGYVSALLAHIIDGI